MKGLRQAGACSVLALALAACAPMPAADAGVRVTPDDPGDPRRVRFEVPTAMLMGLPHQYAPPVTGQARMATRAIAAQELAHRGLCAAGFEGPAGIHFSEDRSRAAFTVHCRR